MDIKKTIKWAPLVISGMLVLILTAILLVMTLGVSINLDRIRDRVDAAATKALGRTVNIEGSVSLLVSFQPSLEIQGVRIGNPPDWEPGDFVRAELIRGRIDIVPLLRGRIRIGELRVDGIQLSLRTTADGKSNWHFDIAPSPVTQQEEGEDDNDRLAVEFVELRELALHQVAVTYHDGGLNRTYEFKLDEVEGSAAYGEPMLLSIGGSFQEAAFSFTLKGDSFENLVNPAAVWNVLLTGRTGESPVQIDGSFHPHGAESEARLEIMAKNVSLGGLMSEFGLPEAMEVNVDRFGMNMVARGRNLKEILERSTFQTSLENGRWFWPDPENEMNMEFTIGRSVIRSTGGKPIELEIDGTIQTKPFKVSLTGDPLVELVLGEKAWEMQLSAEIANAVLRGNAVLVGQEEVTQVTYDLVSEKVDIGEMLRLLNITPLVKASVDSVRLNIVARGKNPRELLTQSDLTVDLQNGRYWWQLPSGKEGFQVLLEQGAIQSLSGKPLNVSLGGKIERKTYSLLIAGDSLANLIVEREPWSLEMSGKFDKAPVNANMSLVRPADLPEIRMTVETGKISIGDILDWLQIAKGMKASVDRMQASITARGNDLQEMMARTDFSYTLTDGYWTLKNPNMDSTVKVIISKLDLARQANTPLKLSTRGQINKSSPPRNEKPVKFEINAAARVEPPKAPGTDKSAKSDQQIYKVNVNGKIAESPLKIAGLLDRSKEVPTANLDLMSEQVDIGGIMGWLEIVEGLEAEVGVLKMNIAARGKDLDAILAKSDLSISLENGKWSLRDPNTQASTDIQIVEGVINSIAGKPITLTLDGLLKSTPVQMKMQTASLAAFAEEIELLPLSFEAQAAGAHLKFSAEVPLPVTGKTLDCQLSFSGEELNSLDELLEVSLPPLGPYSLHGRFGMNPNGYQISDFAVRVGQSDLKGEASLDTTGAKPRLNIDLNTKTLQINDFDLKGWSAVEKKDIESGPAEQQEERDDSYPREYVAEIQTLLSPEVMQAFDARLVVQVSEVLSGEDTLGSGSVVVVLENGRFSVNPLQLNIPGGAVRLSLAYEPTGGEVLGEASANIEKFDYGILARRVKPDAKMKGKISLAVKLESRAAELATIMHNANGYIDFGIWPEDLEAGIFDLWAVNLFTAILPEVDKEETSKVNCIIGQYSLKDGQLREDTMVIDTTRMRVKGEAKADFKREQVYLYLESSGKRPEFFSLATPIEVQGRFSDFQIGIAPGGLIGTTIIFITSPLHVPIRRIFSEDLPPAGEDVCLAPLIERNN